jgi:Animal haem peroxidase
MKCPFAPQPTSEHFVRQSFIVQATLGVPVCPAAPQHCAKSKYRTLDGSCNNLENPAWGAAVNRYGRLLAPIYADGASAIPLAKSGRPLPNARLISLIVFGDDDEPDPVLTLANMQWGQIVTHDMSRGAGLSQSKEDAIRCCEPDGTLTHQQHPACFPILPPRSDPYYSKTQTQCLNFMRTQTDFDRNCPGQRETAEQLTSVTVSVELDMRVSCVYTFLPLGLHGFVVGLWQQRTTVGRHSSLQGRKNVGRSTAGPRLATAHTKREYYM